jgi:hypothetical protein
MGSCAKLSIIAPRRNWSAHRRGPWRALLATGNVPRFSRESAMRNLPSMRVDRWHNRAFASSITFDLTMDGMIDNLGKENAAISGSYVRLISTSKALRGVVHGLRSGNICSLVARSV